MQATDTFMDHEIRVDATRNANGAWVAQVRIFRDGAPVDLPAPGRHTRMAHVRRSPARRHRPAE